MDHAISGELDPEPFLICLIPSQRMYSIQSEMTRKAKTEKKSFGLDFSAIPTQEGGLFILQII